MANVTIAPDADTEIIGNWAPNTGATYYAVLDEASADDTDFILSGATPNQDRIKIRLSDPASAMNDPMTIAVRCKASSGTINLAVRLVEGTTTIAEWTESAIASTWTTYTHELTAGERASISDFTNLFVELEANPSADSTLLAGETDGMAVDFTVASVQVQTRASSADTFTNPQTFFTNAGTSPKYVASATGIAWSPHNLLLQSQTLQTTWSPTSVTVTADDATAPDGTTTADKLEATGSDSYVRQTVSLVSAHRYCFSIYMKAGSATSLDMYELGGATSTTFNVTTSWQRFTFSFTCADPSTIMQIGGGSTFSTGEIVWAWGAQLNRGYFATEYLATTSAAKIGSPVSYGEGLLVEPASTNVALRSQDFSTTWSQTDTTRTSTNNTAPDGSATATLLTEGTAGTAATKQAITISGNAQYAISLYLKAGTAQWVRVGFYETGTTTNRVDCWFDLSTGTLGTPANGGTGSVAAGSITNIGGSWYRCVLTGKVNNAATAVTFDLSSASADASTTRVNSVTYQAWGGQAETGTVATSYIPTVGGTVTRAHDQISCSTSSMGVSATVGTLYTDFSQKVNTQYPFVWQLQDLRHLSDNGSSAFDNATGAGDLSITLGTLTAATGRNQTTCAYQANNCAGSLNGAAIVTDVTATIPTFTNCYFGCEISGGTVWQLGGFIKRFVYVPRRVADGNLPNWRYNF